MLAFALSLVALAACSQDTNERIAAEIAPYAVSFASAAFVWLAGWGARWMAAHTKNANIQTGIVRLNDAVNVAVRAAEQTTVAALKAATPNGRLSMANGRLVVDQVANSVKDHFGPKDLIELAKNLGVPDVMDLVKLRIEAAVQNLRAPDASPAPVAGVASPAPVPAAAPSNLPAQLQPSAEEAIAALRRAARRA